MCPRTPPSVDVEPGADPEGLPAELHLPHVDVLVPRLAAVRTGPEIPGPPAGALGLDQLNQVALQGSAVGALQVDLVPPLELRVERIGQHVAPGVDPEDLRVGGDERPLAL